MSYTVISGKYGGCSNIGMSFGKKNTLQNVLCGNVHCHDARSTFLAKYSICFDECTAVNIPKLEGRIIYCIEYLLRS
jgi:hypothetical protein